MGVVYEVEVDVREHRELLGDLHDLVVACRHEHAVVDEGGHHELVGGLDVIVVEDDVAPHDDEAVSDWGHHVLAVLNVERPRE